MGTLAHSSILDEPQIQPTLTYVPISQQHLAYLPSSQTPLPFVPLNLSQVSPSRTPVMTENCLPKKRGRPTGSRNKLKTKNPEDKPDSAPIEGSVSSNIQSKPTSSPENSAWSSMEEKLLLQLRSAQTMKNRFKPINSNHSLVLWDRVCSTINYNIVEKPPPTFRQMTLELSQDKVCIVIILRSHSSKHYQT